MKPRSACRRLLTALAVLAATVWVNTSAHCGPIEVIAENGVSETEKAQVQCGIEAALKVFDEFYGSRLKQDVRIILVPNRDRYLAWQMELTRGDAAEAARRSETSMGWSSGDTILQNTGDLRDARRRVYNISHELAHALQHQACAGDCSGVAWLEEGNASAIGWHVVERCGLGNLNEYRRWALRQLKGNSNIVFMGMLRSMREWNSALAAYDGQVYSTSALAVLGLIQTQGHPAVFAFFRNLRHMSAEQAFERAFGEALPLYEELFDQSLRNELAAMR